MQYTNNTIKKKKQPPRWDSSPGVLSDFFPPKLPEPCPPPPVQANKSLAEKISDVCQHYEVKCGCLEVSQGYSNTFDVDKINSASTRPLCDYVIPVRESGFKVFVQSFSGGPIPY